MAVGLAAAGRDLASAYPSLPADGAQMSIDRASALPERAVVLFDGVSVPADDVCVVFDGAFHDLTGRAGNVTARACCLTTVSAI